MSVYQKARRIIWIRRTLQGLALFLFIYLLAMAYLWASCVTARRLIAFATDPNRETAGE